MKTTKLTTNYVNFLPNNKDLAAILLSSKMNDQRTLLVEIQTTFNLQKDRSNLLDHEEHKTYNARHHLQHNDWKKYWFFQTMIF